MSLTETFVTLTLGQVCSHVGMPEASDANLKEVEEEIVEMVSHRGSFVARIAAVLH